MVVYIVISHVQYEDMTNILGVFSSKEKAEIFVDTKYPHFKCKHTFYYLNTKEPEEYITIQKEMVDYLV